MKKFSISANFYETTITTLLKVEEVEGERAFLINF